MLTAAGASAAKQLSARTRLPNRPSTVSGTRLSAALTSAYKLSVLPELVKFVSDLIIEDRNYRSKVKEELRRVGIISSSLISQEERDCGKEKQLPQSPLLPYRHYIQPAYMASLFSYYEDERWIQEVLLNVSERVVRVIKTLSFLMNAAAQVRPSTPARTLYGE